MKTVCPSITHMLHAVYISQKKFVKAGCAVRLPFLLLEDALAELPQTESTHKVLGMKLAIKSRDATAGDGLTTSTTQSSLSGVKMQSTEGPPI